MSIRAFSCTAGDVRTSVPMHDALRLADDGAVIVVTGALGHRSYLTQFEELFLDEVAAISSVEAAAHLRQHGLQRMHEVLTADEVADLLPALDRQARRFAVPFANAMVELTSGESQPHYFICSRTWVRIHVPYRLIAERPEILSKGHLNGHLIPTTAHRDVDLTHPHGTLSMWAAVGPICAGNSLEIFDVGRTPGEASSTAVAEAVRPTLDPGDMVIFNADRLHGSVRNETDDTRVAIGVRIVLGRLLHYGPGTHWRPFYDSQLVGTRLEPLATLQSRCTAAAFRRWRWHRSQSKQQPPMGGVVARST